MLGIGSFRLDTASDWQILRDLAPIAECMELLAVELRQKFVDLGWDWPCGRWLELDGHKNLKWLKESDTVDRVIQSHYIVTLRQFTAIARRTISGTRGKCWMVKPWEKSPMDNLLRLLLFCIANAFLVFSSHFDGVIWSFATLNKWKHDCAPEHISCVTILCMTSFCLSHI